MKLASVRRRWPALVLGTLAVACLADDDSRDEEIEVRADGPRVFQLGDPIEGLSAQELAAFRRGRDVFERRFRPSEGLGPFYNATSCAGCHSTPVSGGSAALYRNFYVAAWKDGDHQSPLPPFMGPVVPAFGSGDDHQTATSSTLVGPRTSLPSSYNGSEVIAAQRNTLPLFGVGLFEAVSDVTIMRLSDPDDSDGDGISGRFNTDFGASVGRFGVKAQSNSIEAFTRGPLQNQMGITSEPFQGRAGTVGASHSRLAQVSANPHDETIDHDPVADPEISHADLGDLIAFTRFLAPPPKKPFDAAARKGEARFEQLGCARCHVPVLPSARGPIEAYTDLLLHDLGPELSDGLDFGVPQFSSSAPAHVRNEFRTQPLWGVSMHAPFLHDGRAPTLESAILMHGGEAQASRDGFAGLPAAQRAELIRFLDHL